MRIIFPAEIIFIIGIILFAMSLFIAGWIIRRLLRIIKHKGIWVLPIIGSILMLIGAVIHIFKLAKYFPALATSTPYEILPLIATTMKVGTMESLMILTAGIFTILASLIYFRWTST
ncbi:MAG: hypothetical protein R6U31_03240 [bacterium]